MSELKKHTYTIPGSQDREILIDVTLREDFTPKPIIIFAHGYKGYKDWGAWNLVADAFANAGFTFIKFNFSHNGGTVENPIDFPDLEAFGKNTYSFELDDILKVIDWSKGHDWGGQADTDNIGLIGHSRGGGIVLLAANESEAVKAVSTWAAVRDFAERFPTGQDLEQWREDGVRHIKNGRTGQDMPHYIEFYDDFQRNEDRLHIESATRSMNKPLFIVHGASDEAVDADSAESLFAWSETALMEIIEGAGHTFGAKQPWGNEELPPHLKIVTDDSIVFFREELKK